VKTSLSTLLLFVAGIPLIMRRRMGDGRLFILLWAILWFVPFSFSGGKFTRYFAIPEPLILIGAGVAFYFIVKWLTDKLQMQGSSAALVQGMLFVAFLAVPAYDSFSVAPHYRMFTNTIGGGMSAAGTYFPHDEFYDAGSREVVTEIAKLSVGQGLIACEATYLLDYYADRVGVPKLDTVLLSDPQAVARLKEGDFVVLTSGRRYFSNQRYQQAMSKYTPDSEVRIAGATFARIYRLDSEKLQAMRTASPQ
ncbi:MAG: hypothetical protein JO314_14185, partial [Acidobacteria bacterium]|nr:hypothetical protein [Acidobacteriota bacterium]